MYKARIMQLFQIMLAVANENCNFNGHYATQK